MNKKLQNVIIFGIFLLLVFSMTLTKFFSAEILYPSINKENTSFDGLIFDQPVNVSNLSLIRSIENDNEENLYKYDISFTYTGDPTDLRILNSPVRQIFFPEGVTPSRSNATLKGEYDKVNKSILESLHLKDIYSLDDDFKFLTKSEIRVPLSEKVGEYSFTIYTSPRQITGQGDKFLGDIGIFITNAKVQKFTDNLGLKEKNLKPITNTKTQSGTFINSLELVDQGNVSSQKTFTKVSTALFILSVLAVLLIIAFLDKKFKWASLIAIYLILITGASVFNKGLTNTAIFLILPILSYIGYLVNSLLYNEKMELKSKDFKQALGMTIVFFFLCVLIFIVPRGI